jgi:ketosteroid isomerase-like protein
MSSENIELVKANMLDAMDHVKLMETGRLPLDPAAFEPDFEVVFIPPRPDRESANYRGIKGLVEGWSDWLTPWQSYYVLAEDMIDAGDNVLVPVRVQGITKRNPVMVQRSAAAIWTVRNGRVVRVRFYLYRYEAFEAAGVEEKRRISDS